MLHLKNRINDLVSKIKASDIGTRIATGAFWSFFGTAMAKFLVLVSSIICARILTKEEYGEFGMIRSTISMFVVFGAAGLGLTATKYISEYRKNHKERIASIFLLTNGFAIITGLLVTGLVLVFSPYLANHTLHAPHLEPSIRLGAILLFVTVINGAQSGALSGFEDFRSIALNTLIGSIIESALMIVGAYYWGVPGALLGYSSGFIALCIVNDAAIRKNFRKERVRIRLSLFQKEDFPILYKFSLPAALCSIVVAPTIWIAKTMLTQKAGFDELAVFEAADQWKIMILFIPTAVSQVVLPILSSIIGVDTSRFWKVFKTNLYLNGGIALIMAVIIAVFSPFIMRLYGKAYVSDYWTLIILAASAIFSSMANVVGLAITSRSKMWTGLLFNCLWALMLIVFSFLFVGRGMGARGLALAFTVSYAIHTVLQLIYIRLISNRESPSV